jgi:large subunit ribosomal protein L20
MAQKRRKNTLARAKGYRGLRSRKERYAHEALLHAGHYAFDHRKNKKTDFRQLWIVRLNAAVRENLPAQAGGKPMSYSVFISKMKKNGFALDRKVLAEFATEHPEIFARIAKKVA